MNKKEKIFDFWKKRVQQFGQQSIATLRENDVRENEIRTIQKYLSNGLNIIDIGCGNGYSTIKWAKKFHSEFLGIDFVPDMVDTAQLNLKEAQKAIKGTLNFQVGDVQKLNLNKKFDIAITERTLQNLSTFNDQINAIRSISDHLKPGGKFLMVECSTSSVNKINKKLSHLNRELIDPMPWHNLFFHDNELIQNVEKKSSLKLKKIDRFSSNYIYVTRIMRKVWQERLFRFGFRNFIWKIPQIGDWGYFKLYIWEKSCD